MAHKIVGRYDTRCSACKGNASQDETWHFHGGPGSMWGKHSSLDDINGCGAQFDEPTVYPYIDWSHRGPDKGVK